MKKILIKTLVLPSLLLLPLSQHVLADNGYCASQGNNTNFEWVESIDVNGTTYASGDNNGYIEHTSPVATMQTGDNTITITPGFGSGIYTENWRGWLDSNNDGIFDPSELLFEHSGNAQHVVNVVVPEASAGIDTTLRITMKYGSYAGSCGNYTYGETEDIPVSIEDAAAPITHHLTLSPEFMVQRDGALGESVNWIVEKDGNVVLQRNAASELEYSYFSNTQGSDYRIWLQKFIDGSYQRISNIVEYTPGITDLYELGLGEDYLLERSGSIGDSVQWVIEKDDTVVLQRNAANELDYTYFSNTEGSSFRVWLQQFIDGEYKVVSNTIEYEVGQNAFTLTVDGLFGLTRNGQLGDSVQWVIEKDSNIVLERNAANELEYTYFSNTPGSSFRVWLKMFIDGSYQVVSNIVEYDVPSSYAYGLTLGANYELTRTGNLGDSVGWVVIKDGSVVLQRNAANELSYTYFSNTPGSTIQVYLRQFISGAYQQVSNVVQYTVQ
ncbi:hypothetical protein A9Q99_17435 [Gammaproteobacteria bacterium 45_16_T64]|nr:hypothetical protein A9Q99_17435 [Gammaproteobacteria bacterium 45_16_T64]